MTDRPARNVRSDRTALAVMFAVALSVRVAAAYLVEREARSRGTLCLFDDTRLYWDLAGTILDGRTYVANQYGIPHFALRTPGYPLFLAGCRTLFGASSTLAPRIVQAILGACGVPIAYFLTRRVWIGERTRKTALMAAGFTAIEPYWAATSALLLSEAVFVPLMLLMLWGLAALWGGGGVRFPRLVAMGAGLAAGAAVMVKPSWALAVPLMVAAWVVATRTRRDLALAVLFTIGVVAVMLPWWIRNERKLGEFVPTALWAGASLYDGLNPDATGASDMRFLDSNRFRPLGEIDQDRVLRREALSFAQHHPGRAVALAMTKAGRFWSLWPNAEEFRATWTNLASASVTLPMFLMLAFGVWLQRHDGRALILLAGPLVYFFALHLIFVSSIRYRIPAMVPAFALAAVGWHRIYEGATGRHQTIPIE